MYRVQELGGRQFMAGPRTHAGAPRQVRGRSQTGVGHSRGGIAKGAASGRGDDAGSARSREPLARVRVKTGAPGSPGLGTWAVGIPDLRTFPDLEESQVSN